MLRSILERLLFSLTLLLALMLPFEIVTYTVILPWVELTNLEALVYLTAAVGAAHLLTGSGRTQARRVLTDGKSLFLPAFVFLALAAVSAAAASSHRTEAFKFVLRFATGVYAVGLIAYVADTRSRFVTLLSALVVSAGVSALLGLGEIARLETLDPILSLFKIDPSRVGGTLRLSGTFQYTTIASVFFEMTTPIAVVLAASARTRVRRIVAGVCTLLLVIAIVLTLTRTGMVTLAVTFALLLATAWWQPHTRTTVRPAVLGVITLVVVIGLLTVRTSTFRTRLTTENDLNWYGATYSAPSTLTFGTDAPKTVTVSVHNTGEATWQPNGEHAFAFGYYWLDADGQRLDVSPEILPLPHAVQPGERIELAARVQPNLPAGTYHLAWGMLQRDILWFRHRDVPEATTAVTITASAADTSLPSPAVAPPDELEDDPLPPTVGRLTLWRAAFRMWRERPLLGVGPDNFRHLYGQYLDMDEWDEGLHANNMYIELVTDLGLLGATAFGWLVLAAGWHLFVLLRTPDDRFTALWAAALAAGLGAFLVHGLLDYFLEFTSMYLLFWMTLGFTIALMRVRRNQRLAEDRGSEVPQRS